MTITTTTLATAPETTTATTATPATTATVKTEVLEILSSLGVSPAEAKDLRDLIVDNALEALSIGLSKIGPDSEWSNLWIIPRRHSSESWKGYMSRLHEWAWKYILNNVIVTEFMVDDYMLEDPMHSLPDRPVEFWTQTMGLNYILRLEDVKTAMSYASAAVWSVRCSTTVQPDDSEVDEFYLTVDSPDEGECGAYCIGSVNGQELYLPDGTIGNVSASRDATVSYGKTLPEALAVLADWESA